MMTILRPELWRWFLCLYLTAVWQCCSCEANNDVGDYDPITVETTATATATATTTITTDQNLACKETIVATAAADGSTTREMYCLFRLKQHIPPTDESSSSSSSLPLPSPDVVELNSCAGQQAGGGEGGNSNNDNNYCISASISIRPNELKQSRNDDENKLEESSSSSSSESSADASTNSNSNPASTDGPASTRTTTTTTTPLPKENQQPQHQEEQTLQVGVATYRPPYSQYGRKVADVLAHYPHQYANEPIALANWYLQLGMAHFPNENDDVNNNAYDWYSYPLELTLNALHLAISVFGDDNDDDDVDIVSYTVEQKVFIASVHYSLGEAYFIDPELGQLKKALEEYQNAYNLYEDVLEVNPMQKQQIWDVPDTERRYADACAKLGMALIQNMDPMAMMMMMNDPMNMMNMNDQDGFQESHTRLVSMDDTAGDGGHPGSESSSSSSSSSPFAKPQAMFSKSILIFERLLRQELGGGGGNQNTNNNNKNNNNNRKVDWFIIDLRMGLSLALQHAATTGILMADPKHLQDALEKFQYAIRLHKMEILPHLRIDGPEYISSKTTLADLYISLADAALQAGNYEVAKDAYTNAMQWHEQHNIAVAPLPPITEDHELALEDHLKLLQEYRSMVGGGGGNNGGVGQQKQQRNDQKLYPKGNDEYASDYYYYERDDGYEGDMMANIGSLYMAKGQTEAAIAYMEQALTKYQSEAGGQAMADLKLNLAMAYYRARRFQDSQRLHLEALSAFQELYGDGVNPFVQILDRYEEMMMQQQQQGFGGGGMFQQRQQQQPPPKEEGTADDQTGEAVQGKVIDLDQYRSSIKNATVATTAVKEEL